MDLTKVYLETRMVRAMPMTKAELYSSSLDIVNNDNPEGYAVYFDDRSFTWMPKEVFMKTHRQLTDEEVKLIFNDK